METEKGNGDEHKSDDRCFYICGPYHQVNGCSGVPQYKRPHTVHDVRDHDSFLHSFLPSVYGSYLS